MRRSFKRARVGNGKARTDLRGPVIVLVQLRDVKAKGGTRLKAGNVMRSLTVADAKVSDVFAFVEKSLFPK